MTLSLTILGCRGIPAKHGGFETFAEKLALHLVQRGWKVTVHCQSEGNEKRKEVYWGGVHLVNFSVIGRGAFGTVWFDLKSVFAARNRNTLFLTLGYNTACFDFLHRVRRQINLINMDGVEWRRKKWGRLAKVWLWANERIACIVGNHLIADHPCIEQHLKTRVSKDKVTMVPYGADEVLLADERRLSPLGVVPNGFSTIIARPEPENSVLEIVQAFSQRQRGHKLLVLGNFDTSNNLFHKQVIDAASEEVLFPGAIYDTEVIKAIRFFSRIYLHGHQVGGTNPSLVEAMGAGCAVVAHDNVFNRWVAGEGATYFSSISDLDQKLSELLYKDNDVSCMKEHSRARFRERFTWEQVLSEYEALLTAWHPR